MPLERLDANPLLTPDDVQPTRDDLEIYSTLNPGAVRFGDEILLMVRVGERPIPADGSVASVHFDADAGELKAFFTSFLRSLEGLSFLRVFFLLSLPLYLIIPPMLFLIIPIVLLLVYYLCSLCSLVYSWLQV